MSRLFHEVWKECGVDEEATYQEKRGAPIVPATWIMVPEGKYNFVYLRGGKDLKLDYDKNRLTVQEIKDSAQASKFPLADAFKQSRGVQAKNTGGSRTSDPVGEALVRAGQESASLLAISSNRQGEAHIHAKAGTTIKETLNVGVHPHTELQLNFHFVMLAAGGGKPTPLSKSWNTSHVKQWIADLNGIFAPQANISFKSHQVKEPTVASYRGGRGTYRAAEEWSNEVGHLREKADANIFLVGSWKGIGDDAYKDTYGSYIIATRDIVCDDRPDYDLFMTTLAHEIGHFLGYRRNIKFGHPDGDKRHWLMTTVNWRNGMKVPRQYVLYFNPKNAKAK